MSASGYWLCEKPAIVIDGGALLDAGETPVGKATSALSEMEPGEVLVISAPFQPAPLIDSLRSKGHDVFASEQGDGSWKAWIRKA